MLAAVDMTTDHCHNNFQAPNSIAAARKSLAQLLDACNKSRVFAAGRRPFARIYRRLVAALVRFLGSSIQTNGRVGPRSQVSGQIVVLLRDSESRDEARLLLLIFLQTLASAAKRRGPAAFVQHSADTTINKIKLINVSRWQTPPRGSRDDLGAASTDELVTGDCVLEDISRCSRGRRAASWKRTRWTRDLA